MAIFLWSNIYTMSYNDLDFSAEEAAKHSISFSIKKPYEIKVELTNKDCMPTFGSEEAGGLDMRANIFAREGFIVVPAGGSTGFDLGCKIQIPKGWCGIVIPRSGIGREYKLKIDNTIGLIDSDYRGVISVALTNTGNKDLIIDHGMRICQMAIVPHLGLHNSDLVLVDSLDTSIRGENGFGSSGKK